MSQATILVGAQWGDEGKGKWVDILSHDHEIVVRYQGGNNAGHTLYVKGEKIVLHQIPSGIFQPNKICALTAGVVINPQEMIKEISQVSTRASVNSENLWLSARCHVISPWAIERDSQSEQQSSQPIGTTRRGIGPTYSDKAARVGLRLGDYCDPERRQAWQQAWCDRSAAFASFIKQNQSLWQSFLDAAEMIQPFVTDCEHRLRQAMVQGQCVLLEGAQGALLDIDHGTYPFVTSSSTSAGGAFASLGFSGHRLAKVIGISKAYLTRVGAGPMPTELQDADGQHLAKKGHEFGATTGRPRRCGWLDGVALSYAQAVNGFDELIINKLDVLSGLEQVKVCVAYRHPELGILETFPWDYRVLEKCEPQYQSFPGWQEELAGVKSMAQLPVQARDFLKGLAEVIHCPLSYVGTGVGREDFIKI